MGRQSIPGCAATFKAEHPAQLLTVVHIFILAAFGARTYAALITLDYPGAAGTFAEDISGNNIVGSYYDDWGRYHGFLYDGSTYTTIEYPGAESTWAYGVSGNRVVGLYLLPGNPSLGWHAFLWDGSGFTTIDPPGATYAQADGISGTSIVGTYRLGRYHGFLYDGSTYTTFDPPESSQTGVHGISGNRIVGEFRSLTNSQEGFLYDGSAYVTIEFPGAIRTAPHGISGNNIVGFYEDEISATHYHMFFYDGSTYSSMDYPGATYQYATGISGDNIVGSYSLWGTWHGFLATMADFSEPVPPDFQGCILTISSTPGGTVVDPGVGTFYYDCGQLIVLEAQARPGFVFTHWSGSYFDATNPTYFSVEANHHIQANFARLKTIYVDAHAPGDPKPNDLSGSDPKEDGTTKHPFDSIQEAIAVAGVGTDILVREGVYREQIDLTNKALRLQGLWLSGPDRTGEPVIEASGTGSVVKFGADANSVLSGFRVQGGRAQTGAAILCAGARAVLSNCLIVGNRVDGVDGGIIDCRNSNLAIINCTIQGNAGVPDAAVFAAPGCQMLVTNSVVWGNTPLKLTSTSEPTFTVAYCDVEGAWPGNGNLSNDPLFIEPGYWNDAATPGNGDDDIWIPGDYHVQSQAGRWDPVTRTWLTDEQSSPCIDAGDPNMPGGQEPTPNGGRINLGVYGGTNQASMSAGGS